MAGNQERDLFDPAACRTGGSPGRYPGFNTHSCQADIGTVGLSRDFSLSRLAADPDDMESRSRPVDRIPYNPRQ